MQHDVGLAKLLVSSSVEALIFNKLLLKLNYFTCISVLPCYEIRNSSAHFLRHVNYYIIIILFSF